VCGTQKKIFTQLPRYNCGLRVEKEIAVGGSFYGIFVDVEKSSLANSSSVNLKQLQKAKAERRRH
jgi:hypothetical protein